MRNRRRGGDRRQADRRKPDEAAANTMVVNGWTLLAYPLFLEGIEKLVTTVEDEQRKNPNVESGYAKLLANLLDLALEKIPANPASPAFRHGGAIDGGGREWFRAKTGNGRYRLFFRYHTRAKVIVYAWVNDEKCLRTYGSSTDAYLVFAGMLAEGNPPDDWDELVAAARDSRARERLARLTSKRAKK